MHIRTIPKIKVTLDMLVERGYMTTKQKKYLIKHFKAGESVILSVPMHREKLQVQMLC